MQTGEEQVSRSKLHEANLLLKLEDQLCKERLRSQEFANKFQEAQLQCHQLREQLQQVQCLLRDKNQECSQLQTLLNLSLQQSISRRAYEAAPIRKENAFEEDSQLSLELTTTRKRNVIEREKDRSTVLVDDKQSQVVNIVSQTARGILRELKQITRQQGSKEKENTLLDLAELALTKSKQRAERLEKENLRLEGLYQEEQRKNAALRGILGSKPCPNSNVENLDCNGKSLTGAKSYAGMSKKGSVRLVAAAK